MPLSLMVRPSRSDTYCDPRSEWRVQPAGGLLRAIAILSASSASPASMRSDIDQPTALPGHMSITSVRQGHLRRVRTQAMSANQALSGPSAVKSCPHRVGGGPGLRRGCPRRPLRPPRAAARGAGPAVVAHGAGHALARRAEAPAPKLHVHPRRAVDAPARLVDLRDQPRELGVPEIAGARPPAPPGVVALPGHPERRAHVRDPPGALVGRYERELSPLRGRPYS